MFRRRGQGVLGMENATAEQCRSGSFGRVLVCSPFAAWHLSELLRHYRPIEYPPQPKTQRCCRVGVQCAGRSFVN